MHCLTVSVISHFLSLSPSFSVCVSVLARKHYKVIQAYYLKYMSGFDAAYMRDVVMVSCGEHHLDSNVSRLIHAYMY